MQEGDEGIGALSNSRTSVSEFTFSWSKKTVHWIKHHIFRFEYFHTRQLGHLDMMPVYIDCKCDVCVLYFRALGQYSIKYICVCVYIYTHICIYTCIYMLDFQLYIHNYVKTVGNP